MAKLDEVLDEHVRVSQGLLERSVGRWSELKFVGRGRGRERAERECQVSAGVFLASGLRHRAGGGVVHTSANAVG